MRPRFSVVIPVHNRADVVGRAVASVVAQTFADLEVVVVDDGSSDDSTAAARAVADTRVRIVRQEHAGTAAARAAGLRRSQGTWIVFLDPDDEIAPGLLARFGRLIEATGAELVSCAGDQQYVDGTRTTFAPVSTGSEFDPDTALTGADGHVVKTCLRSGSWTATRERLRRVGAFGVAIGGQDDDASVLGRDTAVLSSTVHSAGTGCLDLAAHDRSCLDPEAFDPEATTLEPTALQPTALEPTALGPTALGPTGLLPAGSRPLGLDEIGRRALLSVLEDGQPVVHTPESMVCWYEPDAEPAPDGDRLRLHWALQAIDAVARTPIPDGELLARYATIGGVAAARLRDHRESRRLFRLARRAIPDVPKHWVRWMVACVPPAADRVWEPTTAPAAATRNRSRPGTARPIGLSPT